MTSKSSTTAHAPLRSRSVLVFGLFEPRLPSRVMPFVAGAASLRTGAASLLYAEDDSRLKREASSLAIYNRPMAIEFVAQRLEIGDVILLTLPEQDKKVEATVVRGIDRTDTTVRATLRVTGREDFVEEWPLGQLVTVVRGP